MAEPDDMIVPMLRGIREDITTFRDEMRTELQRMETRLDGMDGSIKSLRNAMTADTMMSKFMLGDYEERLAKLEAKVDDLLNRH